MGDIFDPNGPGANLLNFGFSGMAAAAQPGIPTLSALGQGGLGMNAAALQRAQTQNIQGEAQSRQLQNQLIPYQIKKMQQEMSMLQGINNRLNPQGSQGTQDNTANNSNQLNPTSKPPNSGGQPWQPSAGATPNNPNSNNTPSVMNMQPAVYKTAQRVGIDPALLHGVYMTESGGNPNAPTGDGGAAIGGMQLHAGAAQDAGVKDRTDPAQNLTGGATYLKQLQTKYSDPNMTALAYNWGEGNVDNWVKAGADPTQIPQPQQKYVQNVNKYANQVGGLTPSVMQNSQQNPQRNFGQGVASNADSENEKNAEALGLGYGFLNPALGSKIYENLTAGQKAQAEAQAKGEEERKTQANKAQLDVTTAAPKAEAEKTGADVADAKKTVSAIDSRIGNVKSIIAQMRQLSTQMPDRSLSPDTSVYINKHFGDQKTETAWNQFGNLNNILFTQELPGIVPAGSRLDIPIVNALQSASKVDPYASNSARLSVLNDLESRIDAVSQNAHKNYGILSGKEADNAPPTAGTAQSVTHVYRPGIGIVPVGAQ